MKKMFKTHSKSYTARELIHFILREIDMGYDTYEDAIQFKHYGVGDPVIRIRIVKKLKRIMKQRGIQI